VRRLVYIEAWRDNYDDHNWRATITDTEEPKEWDYPASWFNSPHWNYKYTFNGKKAFVTFCSNDVFSREEALGISLLIVEGKGVKAWRIELS